MSSLVAVRDIADILPAHRGNPVAELLEYHNLGTAHRGHDRADLLIGMCMDNRIKLRVPSNFAYVLRAGGANLRRIEFKVSYAVAVGGIRTICLIGHSQCGMVDLHARRDVFVDGLVANGGWERAEAERHFEKYASVFEIADPQDFVLSEAERLRERYPRVRIATLFYRVEDGQLYQLVA